MTTAPRVPVTPDAGCYRFQGDSPALFVIDRLVGAGEGDPPPRAPDPWEGSPVLTAFVRAFKTPDLRRKILFTLMVMAIFRLGAFIPTPGVS